MYTSAIVVMLAVTSTRANYRYNANRNVATHAIAEASTAITCAT